VPPFEAFGDWLLELLEEASGVLLDEFVEDKLLAGLLSELVDDGLLTELLLLSSLAPWAEEDEGDWLSCEAVLRPA